MLNRERGMSGIRRQAIRANECWLAVKNPTRSGDECKNYIPHFFPRQHRHPAAFEVTYGETPTAAESAKDTVEKTRNRAGATPLCAAFSRPNAPWGRSRPRPTTSGPCFSLCGRKQQFCQTPNLTICNPKGENNCQF